MADSTVITDITNRMDNAAHHITTPTLLLRGELSDLVDQRSVEHLLRQIPTAHTATVANTGHMVVGDDNDTFTNHLLDFLNHLAPHQQ